MTGILRSKLAWAVVALFVLAPQVPRGLLRVAMAGATADSASQSQPCSATTSSSPTNELSQIGLALTSLLPSLAAKCPSLAAWQTLAFAGLMLGMGGVRLGQMRIATPDKGETLTDKQQAKLAKARKASRKSAARWGNAGLLLTLVGASQAILWGLT